MHRACRWPIAIRGQRAPVRTNITAIGELSHAAATNSSDCDEKDTLRKSVGYFAAGGKMIDRRVH